MPVSTEKDSLVCHIVALNSLLLQWLTSCMLLVGCGNTLWVRLNFTGLRVWDNRSTLCRMLKKAAFSPAPTSTRRSEGKAARGMLLLQRFTHLQNAAGGLFQHPARREVQRIMTSSPDIPRARPSESLPGFFRSIFWDRL